MNVIFFPHTTSASRCRRGGTRCPGVFGSKALKIRMMAVLVTAAFSASAAFAGADDEAVAISARASSDYVRARLANGTIQPETFAFARGGVLNGTQAGTKDMLDFLDVAKTMARPLANQGYLSSRDPKTTRLLIMVYWGTTRTPENPTDSISNQNLATASAAALAANHSQQVHFNPNDSMAPQQMSQSSSTSYAIRSPDQVDTDNALTSALAAAAAEDNQRVQLDAQNASMLGYDSLLDTSEQARGTALEYRRQDLINELEEHRYFVVLMAYDFQLMWKEKKPKLLWETRFSVREKGNDFSKQLAAMTESASKFFGQNSGKLVRATLPEGHVKVGPIRTLTLDQHN